MGEILRASEYVDSNTLGLYGFGSSKDDGVRLLLLQDLLRDGLVRSLFLLVDTQGSNMEHGTAKMHAFLIQLYDTSLVSDGCAANDAT